MRVMQRPLAMCLLAGLALAVAARPAEGMVGGQVDGTVQPRGHPEGLETARNLRMARELLMRLDELALAQAQRQLGLDEARASHFVERFRALQAIRRRYQQQRNRLLMELRKLTNPLRKTSDEQAIAARLGALADLDRRAADEIRTAYEGIDQTLTTFQQARFRIFEERMEERKLDLLMRARERAGRAGPVR